MKTRVFLSLLFLFFLLTAHAEKHALIIAIGDYPESGGWQDIAGDNDAQFIESALKVRGFLDANISIVKNEKATRAGILTALKNIKNNIQKGDVVYIHYSGHGQQILDDDGDEIDELDEAIVPYDSPIYYKSGTYEGDLLIRDDEIGDYAFGIRKILGENGQLVLVLDSCHSGTGTRGRGKARGTNILMAPENFETTKTDNNFGIQNASIDQSQLASMISFFAAGAHELNYEYKDALSNSVGSLSYTFATILTNLNQPLSIQELYDRIKLKMAAIAPNQHPQMEGDPSKLIFNTKDITAETYFPIETFITPKKIKAAFGILHDIPRGSKVEVISLDKKEVLTRGEVVSSSLGNSEIQLEKGVFLNKDELAKVKLVSRAAPTIQCNVQIDLPSINEWNKLIINLQESNLFQEISNDADLYIAACEDDGVLEIRTKEGELLCQTNPSKSDYYNTIHFSKHIRLFAQSQFLRKYEAGLGGLDVDMGLIPIKVQSTSRGLVEKSRLNLQNFQDENGSLQFKQGDAVKIKVTNKGNRPAYYSIIDIQPDHQIALLVPNPYSDYKAADFYLKPGESQEIDYPFVFNPPYGKDMLKLIATEQPLELNYILANNGTLQRGSENSHPFEKLLSYTFQDANTRGTTSTQISSTDVGISSLVYEIIK